MKKRTFLRPVLLLAIVLPVAASCDSGGGGRQTGSETHWLSSCDRDDDCGGELSCICGVCTKPCSPGTSCGETAACIDARRSALSSICGDQTPSGRICVATCADTTQCRRGLVCESGLCVHPAATTGRDAGPKDAAPADRSLRDSMTSPEASPSRRSPDGGVGPDASADASTPDATLAETGAPSGTFDAGGTVTGDEFSITEFEIGVAAGVTSITLGPDGNMWFAMEAGALGRITPDGVETVFPVRVSVGSVTVGPDSNIWFSGSGILGQSTMTGNVTTYPCNAIGFPLNFDREGNLWFMSTDAQRFVSRRSPDGTIQRIGPDEAGVEFKGLVRGPDGNIWVGEHSGIGRFTPAGDRTFFPTQQGTKNIIPGYLAGGPDGNVWFIGQDEAGQGPVLIGRMTTDGDLTFFDHHTLAHGCGALTAAEGVLWIACQHALLRMTTDGVADVRPLLPDGGLQSFAGIAAGRGHTLWLPESGVDRIMRITLR